MGVAALVRLIVAAGDRMSATTWVEAITTLSSCAADTRPAVRELVAAVCTPRPSAGAGDGDAAATERGGSLSGAALLLGTPKAAPAGPAASAAEDSPWDAKSPGDSPRAAITATRLDSTSGERRQVQNALLFEALQKLIPRQGGNLLITCERGMRVCT